jgi:putative serine protease PepD
VTGPSETDPPGQPGRSQDERPDEEPGGSDDVTVRPDTSGIPTPRQESPPPSGPSGRASPPEPTAQAPQPDRPGAEGPSARLNETAEPLPPTEVLEAPASDRPWWTTPPKLAAAIAAIALCAAALGGVIGGVLGANSVDPNPLAAVGDGPSGQDPSGSLVPRVAQAASRSVVEIVVTSGIGKETGSGIVVSSDGRILTNYHVVATAYVGDITGRLPGAGGTETTSARVLGTEPAKDLAMIQADRLSGLTPAKLGDSSEVEVGSPVVAIGSPQGLRGTVTSGIVSAVDRELRVDDRPGLGPGTKPVTYKAIQTDATLHPGNSGGPLVTLDGQVIGINSAIYAAAARADGSGLGFAIPINQARGIIHKYGAADGVN